MMTAINRGRQRGQGKRGCFSEQSSGMREGSGKHAAGNSCCLQRDELLAFKKQQGQFGRSGEGRHEEETRCVLYEGDGAH